MTDQLSMFMNLDLSKIRLGPDRPWRRSPNAEPPSHLRKKRRKGPLRGAIP